MVANELPAELAILQEPPRVCSYLPDQTASLQYRAYAGLSPEQLEFLVERGWRRFGIEVFRPACAACTQCVPVRVEVERFEPSKSQRRNFRKNAHVTVSLHPASVSKEHVELYNAWHDQMTEHKDWPATHQTAQGYARSFLSGDFPSLYEMHYRHHDRLIGLGLVECLPNSLSSVYFFHEPSWRDQGPGTFSLLCEIELSRQLGKKFLYLGYWIAGCQSMSYKNRFHPHQVLLSRPADDAPAGWLNADDENHNVATS